MKQTTKIRLLILILLMAGALGLLLWRDVAEQRRQRTESAQREEQLHPLRV